MHRGQVTHALMALALVAVFTTVAEAAEWWDYPDNWQICRNPDRTWVIYDVTGRIALWERATH